MIQRILSKYLQLRTVTLEDTIEMTSLKNRKPSDTAGTQLQWE